MPLREENTEICNTNLQRLSKAWLPFCISLCLHTYPLALPSRSFDCCSVYIKILHGYFFLPAYRFQFTFRFFSEAIPDHPPYTYLLLTLSSFYVVMFQHTHCKLKLSHIIISPQRCKFFKAGYLTDKRQLCV